MPEYLQLPPLTALGSPIRSKSVLVSQPSPLNPFRPARPEPRVGARVGVREDRIRILVEGDVRWGSRKTPGLRCCWPVAGSSLRRTRLSLEARQRHRSPSHALVSHQPPTCHSITGSATPLPLEDRLRTCENGLRCLAGRQEEGKNRSGRNRLPGSGLFESKQGSCRSWTNDG